MEIYAFITETLLDEPKDTISEDETEDVMDEDYDSPENGPYFFLESSDEEGDEEGDDESDDESYLSLCMVNYTFQW